MAKISRYPNLDLLRALAVAFVVFYHCCNMLGVSRWLWKWSEIVGVSGIDLFCVLSGFLIGSLYWHEQKKYGNVQIWRFIGRRGYRTIPIYYIFLFVAYLGVYFIRGESFSWQHLFFLQNYQESISFYAISWSLCVEEHFYLVMPFLTLLILKLPRKISPLIILILLVIPLLARMLSYPTTPISGFGYYFTATHFRYEGLLIGVIISYIISYKKTFFDFLIPYAYLIYALTFILVSLFYFVDNTYKYYFSITLNSYMYALSLIVAVRSAPIPIATSSFVYKVAVSSYSTYLVHSFVLQFYLYVFNKLGFDFIWLEIPIAFVTSFIVGYAIYKLLEKPIIKLRNKHVPAR
ncbi:acyltransferase [Bernardetia sp. Wsw4-3y2]|uniref:acyltransferase family protein n=1 Tax=unclassified Bernardetia TaxID=2647129 RepID=UPI0030CDD422